jgi:hypothetical protein
MMNALMIEIRQPTKITLLRPELTRLGLPGIVLKLMPTMILVAAPLILIFQGCSPNLYASSKAWETVTITPPKKPQPYSLPEGAVRVSSTTEFIRQFTASPPRDIVLADGLYDNANPVKAGAAHRVWAEHVGDARLTFGLEFDSSQSGPGAAIHGLVFDIKNRFAGARDGPIDDPKVDRAAVRIANPTNTGVHVEDVTIYGNHAIETGIKVYNADGLVIRRCAVSDVTDYGVFVHAFGNEIHTVVPRVPAVIEDCTIKNVYRSTRASNNGRSEACLWVGVKASVSRVNMRNCGWMGLWTGGNTNKTTFSDLLIEDTDIGIYVEHWTRDSLFERFQIGPAQGVAGPAGFKTRIGIVTEWSDPGYKGLNPVPGESLAASHNNTFRDGTINSFVTGIFTDDAENTSVSNIRFLNQRFSGISEFRNAKTGYNTVWQNPGNDFSNISNGAEPYNRQHINSFKE